MITILWNLTNGSTAFSLLNFVYEILPDGLHHCDGRDLPRVQRQPVQLWHHKQRQKRQKVSPTLIMGYKRHRPKYQYWKSLILGQIAVLVSLRRLLFLKHTNYPLDKW